MLFPSATPSRLNVASFPALDAPNGPLPPIHKEATAAAAGETTPSAQLSCEAEHVLTYMLNAVKPTHTPVTAAEMPPTAAEHMILVRTCQYQ